MYSFRQTSSNSFLVTTLVLAICCTIVFACAYQDEGKGVTENLDDPSKIEEPTVDPVPEHKPLDPPSTPEDKENPVKIPSKSPINASKNNTDLPIVIDRNKKPKENEGIGNQTRDESKQLLEGAVNFIRGNMVHVIPDSMPFQKVSKVSLVIGNRNNLESIKEKALELSAVKDTNQIISAKNITIGRKMKAVLSDPMAKVSTAFEITPITSEEQFVDLYHNESVDWLWNVIPLKPGAHELSMTLEVTLKNDLGESTRSIPVYNDKVKIFVPEKVGVPASYDMVASPIDTSNATAQQHSLSSNIKNPTKESGNNYMGLIVGGGAILIGILVFLFLRKQGGNSKNTVLSKFSKKEIKELDRLQSKGDIQEALRYIIGKLPDHDPRRNEVELLWQNYKDNEKDNAKNLIAYEQYTQARSKISLAVITLIDEIRDLSNLKENNQPV